MVNMSEPNLESIEKVEVRDADLNDPEKAKAIVADVRKAVFDEYDRALLEGTAEKGQVGLQKKHIDAVAEIADAAVDVLRHPGKRGEYHPGPHGVISISENQKHVIEIEVNGHDAQKIVPERTKLELVAHAHGIFRLTENLEAKLQKAESGELKLDAAEIGQLQNKIQGLKQEVLELTGKWTSLEKYDQESRIEAGESSDMARLLLHGEDSADWMEQLLTDMNFSPELVTKVRRDIVTHMGMPYVKEALEKVKSERLRGKGYLIPEELEEGQFPEPETLEGAVLFSADLLSAMVLAGEDIDSLPEAGCFDRYIAINLGIYNSHSVLLGLRDAVATSFDSLSKNVDRLRHPPDPEKRGMAADVEKIIGWSLGSDAVNNTLRFMHFVENGFTVKDIRFKNWDSLNVWETTDATKGLERLNIPKTMQNYYMAVKAYREYYKLNPKKLTER